MSTRRKHVFGYIRAAKALISLSICAVCSLPSLSVKRIIGCFTICEWRANARMILCAWQNNLHLRIFTHGRRHICVCRGPYNVMNSNTNYLLAPVSYQSASYHCLQYYKESHVSYYMAKGKTAQLSEPCIAVALLSCFVLFVILLRLVRPVLHCCHPLGLGL